MNTILSRNTNGYGYKYTDISEIHRYLEINNLRYVQFVKCVEGNDYIFTQKYKLNTEKNEYEKDGEPLQGSRIVQATLQGIKNPAQEQGSALTYARRYSLLMAYGLATEDDDGASLNVNKNATSSIQKRAISNKDVTSSAKKRAMPNLTDINKEMNFGKYDSKTWLDVYKVDEEYLKAIMKKQTTEKAKEALKNMIEKCKKEVEGVNKNE